ncbi:SDR family oxidoreductase [Legionella tunisiensis]|uniref:SDR family oxidoreductase n=1 Tax=Legionella tunisiensis TaxID=1034944 RepID=UPI0002DFE681|nr:SDR family oxidoreductase [Legionella tunisiensis]
MNKLAIITGASRGIGKHAAHYFAEQGFDLALIARNESLLNKVSKELTEKFAIKTTVFALDVSDYEAVSKCSKYLASRYQTIDILFNNAGLWFLGSSAIGPDEFNAMIDVNLRGIYNMVHAIVPYMKKQQSGYIFNMASYAGKRPVARSGAYCMTKYGVVGYSQSLSLELNQDNIKVTAICPSVIDTDMTKMMPDFPDEEKILCQDVIETIHYLLQLSPKVYIDEVILKSSFLLKKSNE